MENKKTILGQFFTKEKLWLKPQVLDFIKRSSCDTAFDPFAGGGHLLETAKKIGFIKYCRDNIKQNICQKTVAVRILLMLKKLMML